MLGLVKLYVFLYSICAACWRHGKPAPYIHLARTFDLVEDEKGKIKATSMLCNMFRRFVGILTIFCCRFVKGNW